MSLLFFEVSLLVFLVRVLTRQVWLPNRFNYESARQKLVPASGGLHKRGWNLTNFGVLIKLPFSVVSEPALNT